MLSGILLLVAAVALVYFAFALSQKEPDPYQQAEADRPPELAGAIVVEARRSLSMTVPFRLHGEPDVIYRLRDGTLVVREDKSFYPHPLADRIQASVYAAILRHNPPPTLRGAPVAPYAWIRYGTPGRTSVKWVRVTVFDDGELSALMDRYWALRHGTAPRPTGDPVYCRKVCQHYGERCQGTWAPGKPANRFK